MTPPTANFLQYLAKEAWAWYKREGRFPREGEEFYGVINNSGQARASIYETVCADDDAVASEATGGYARITLTFSGEHGPRGGWLYTGPVLF